MFCSNCGKKVSDEAKFCPYCGNMIPKAPAEPAPQVPAEPAPQVPVEPAPQVSAEPAPQVSAEPAPQVSVEPAPQAPLTPAKESLFQKYKIAIIAIIMVVALAITGVGVYFGTDLFKDDKKSPEIVKKQDEEEKTPDDGEDSSLESEIPPTVVTVWSGDGGGKAVWEDLVDEWNDTVGKEKNISIEWETVMDSQKLDLAYQSGTLPDIIGFGSSMQIKKFRENDALISLDEMPGGKKFLKQYNQPGVEGATMFDGKCYGVQRKATTAALAINVDLFKKAGIVNDDGSVKEPKTIAELRDAAKKIQALGKTDAGENIYGFAFPLKFGLNYTVDTLTTPSFSLDDPASKLDLDTLTVTYPGFKDRYQWILDMKKDGTILPGAETLDNDTARAYFAEGVIGMIPAVSWDVGVYTTQFPAKCEWDICQFPILDGRQEWKNYTSMGGAMYISRSSAEEDEKADAIMEVYKFIYSLETRTQLFECGIEIPCKKDVLKNADKNVVDPRFMKFANLVDEDYKAYPSEAYVTEGDMWGAMFQKVWMGEMSLDAAISDYESRSTAGLKKAVEQQTYDVEKQKETEALKKADFNAWKLKKKAES